ncbi:MAG: SUMF1/EgtB/PvdO family nonheme iron enzyme, partial [Lentisphaeria bacterium]|nr:SUMF1/EgtB/PvdO family nonheme iron enzyme [Lentisphaeria bacterium]
VYEWCLDWYGSGSYSSGAVTDPQGPQSGSDRVLRGGGWYSSAQYCRSASRGSSSPGNRYYRNGFRLALVPVQ